MNLDRYEKIDAEKLLEVLEAGDSIFSEGEQNSVDEYKVIDGMLHSKLSHQFEFLRDRSDVLWFLQQDWYIKKPFDVRQAMLDRPNEWVGAYKKTTGEWLKIGFSTYHLTALVAPLKIIMPVSGHRASAATVYIIDNCIPIEDVPEEATR